MRTATRIGAALLWLLVGCDNDDGTKGWTIASGSSMGGGDTSSGSDDTGGGTVADTGGGGTVADTGSAADTAADAAADAAGADTVGDAGGDATSADTTADAGGDAAAPDTATHDVTTHDVATDAPTDTQVTPDAGTAAPALNLQDVNPNSETYWDQITSDSLAGSVVLIAFHDALESTCRARALSLETLRTQLASTFGAVPQVVAIDVIGSDPHVAAYATQGEKKVFFHILQDTIAAGAFTTWSAAVNDMVLVDLRGGAPGVILERWAGVGQLDPTQPDQYDDLWQVLEGHLQ